MHKMENDVSQLVLRIGRLKHLGHYENIRTSLHHE